MDAASLSTPQDVHWPYMLTVTSRRRSERLEVRTTPEDRALIDRAVAAVGTDLTAFVVSSVTTAARRVLADRTEFIMSPKVAKVWEAINKRQARDLPGLRKLMKRASPFATAWCMASIAVEAAPQRLRKGAGRYPQPVALLARLGVSIQHERRGLGAGMLKDVIKRTAALGTEIGCRGLLVHAETSEASDFYRHLIPEFEPSPTDELHLLLLMKDILRTLAVR